MKKQKAKKAPRNGSALAARMRTAGGPMKHRLEPKKGARNEQAELLEEAYSVPSHLVPEDPKNFKCTCSYNPHDEIAKDCPIHSEEEYECDL